MQSSRATPEKSSSRSIDGVSWWGAASIVAVLAIAASTRGLFNDFVYDDIPLLADNARVHDLSHVGEIFSRAYWPPPFVEQLYRPLTLLFLAVQYVLGDGSPLLFRVVSYALYALASVLVYRLAMRILDPKTAFAVAALFAVHPVHVEAVALAVNQAELIVGSIAVVMTTLYIDRRRSGGLERFDLLLIGGLFGAATLVKESAFILPLLILVAEITVLRDAQPVSRIRVARGVFVTLCIVGAASVAVRWTLAGTHAFAVAPAADLRGLGIGGRMLLMLHVIPIWLRLFVWPRHLQADYAPGEIASGSAAEAMVGALILCAFVGTTAYALRRAPVLAFGLLWLVIALVPVSNIVPAGILVAERTLFLPSIGFVLAVGAVAERLLSNHHLPKKVTRIALTSGCAVLVILGVLRSSGRHAVWNTQHLKIRPQASTVHE